MLTAPQTASDRVHAASGFETEASLTLSPLELLAIGGMVDTILLSVVPIVRASRRQTLPVGVPEAHLLVRMTG